MEIKSVDVIKPYVENFFTNKVLPGLMDFIRIPNLSPSYDPQWDLNGNQEKAASFLASWVLTQNVKNISLNIYKEKKRTPLIFIEVSPTRIDDKRTVLMYSHMDKQPHFTGWSEGLGPTSPVIRDGKLYGRGACDDGYALFSAITAIKTCQENNLSHPRIVIITESAEESYIEDLEFYLSALKIKIGVPDLIVCLDSGCEDYKRLWLTTSLRGVISIDLTVKVLSIGMHSGGGSGLAPDSFMILRKLLDRIEDPNTGEIKPDFLKVKIPENREKEIRRVLTIVGEDFLKQFPFYDKTTPVHTQLYDLIVNNTWQASLAITGADGLPEASSSGNVLRPFTSLRLSIRLPPGVDTKDAGKKVVEILQKNPPFNAKISAVLADTGDGWNLDDKNLSDKIKSILNTASRKYFRNDLEAFGEGGSVPFVQMFNNAFPQAQFAVIGVTGPNCNIHGPDENLDIEFAKKFTCSLAYLISDF